MMRRIAAAFALSTAISAQGVGPAVIAKSSTSLWPNTISSKTEYDQASRAEILIFLSIYKEFFSGNMDPASLGTHSIDWNSMNQWRNRFRINWLNTFLDATKSCKTADQMGCDFKGTNFDKLLEYAVNFSNSLPQQYAPWKTMSRDFYFAYLKEQARLAALFPHPTSEILPLDNREKFGDRFKDGEFLLTFDDGPTATGDTAKYTQLLRNQGISAFFFVLGDALGPQLKKSSPTSLKEMYRGQCIASHGYHHTSHQKMSDWQNSIDKTASLIKQISGVDSTISFRPPYGQRQQQLIDYLTQQHASVILWNIDSQDWQSKINAAEVTVRVEKLMLLWRKGIILFHDVHKKGLIAVPHIIQFGKAGNIQWKSCTAV